jgi:hypothetical protein
MDKEGGEREFFAFGQIAVWHKFLQHEPVDFFVLVYHCPVSHKKGGRGAVACLPSIPAPSDAITMVKERT